MDDFTDPAANMLRGVRYLQDHLPEWFDKNYSVWVDSSNQARQAKEKNMSKKINAGDTLTAGDLTDAHLGAEIEVETLFDITYRFTLGGFGDDWYAQRSLWTPKVRVESFYPNTQVTIITPPPVVQPDEPTVLGQCIRIEGDDGWRAVVMNPESSEPFLDQYEMWWSWKEILSRAGSRQIIVSDPPHWPDETPDVPKRIEVGEWPDDDTHLRAWEWHSVDNRFGDDHTAWWNGQASLWECLLCDTAWRRGGQRKYAWTRGNHVEVATGPKAGDVFTSIEDMPYGWIAKVTLGSGDPWGHVVRYDNGLTNHLWDTNWRNYESATSDWEEYGLEAVSGGSYGETRYTLVETEVYHNVRVARDNA